MTEDRVRALAERISKTIAATFDGEKRTRIIQDLLVEHDRAKDEDRARGRFDPERVARMEAVNQRLGKEVMEQAVALKAKAEEIERLTRLLRIATRAGENARLRAEQAETKLAQVEKQLQEERACHDCDEYRQMMSQKLAESEREIERLKQPPIWGHGLD